MWRTLPKRGYRFIGKVRPEPPIVMTSHEELVESTTIAAASVGPETTWNWRAMFAVCVIGVTVATALTQLWRARKPAAAPSETDATVVVPFTSLPGIETAPSFSPDGSRIAFSWDGDSGKKTGQPKFDLYEKVIGSETLLKLTDHPSDWIASAWSPDGTQVAFHRIDVPDTGIYVVSSLGGPERKLIATHAPYDLAAPISWSPDGKWIAYSDAKTPGIDKNVNFLFNVETLERREIPEDSSCRHEGLPTFSHSGNQLAMLCVHNKDTYDYAVTDAVGNGRRNFAAYKLWVYGALWTPDDEALLVVTNTPSGNEYQQVRVRDGQIPVLR